MQCLVIGGSGQDGVLITAKLLAEGRRVTTASRTASPLANVDHRTIDVANHAALERLVAELKPREIYYLAAHHRSSQERAPSLLQDIEMSLAVNTRPFAAVLGACATHAPEARTVYASSCRVFGLGDGRLIDESACRVPICPYGMSKAAGMSIAEVFRRHAGLHVSSAILFNHESELRPLGFLSKKLAVAALAARGDSAVRVTVTDLDDVADWGSARDYAAAMVAIARAEAPGDFVVASGTPRSVRDFAAACFAAVGLDWRRHVVVAPVQPHPRWRLVGNPSKLLSVTAWRPTCTFSEMVRDVVRRTETHDRQRSADFHSYL